MKEVDVEIFPYKRDCNLDHNCVHLIELAAVSCVLLAKYFYKGGKKKPNAFQLMLEVLNNLLSNSE